MTESDGVSRSRLRGRSTLAFLLSVGVGLACASAPKSVSTDAAGDDSASGFAPILGCESVGRAHPICGFRNPEDLVALPGDAALLVSEYGDVSHAKAGSIALLDIASGERRVVYRGGQESADTAPTSGWGSPDCSGPPAAAFSPHGIDLVRRARDGRWSLLVVQHGDRQAIELFEVAEKASEWQVEWRGCVYAPPGADLNDVAGLADESFYTTKMQELGTSTDLMRGFPEAATGHVYGWSPERGYWSVPGTEGMMPNGVETAGDGSVLYMNESAGSAIRKIDTGTGDEIARAEISAPDNVTWAPDGQSLLVASFGEVDPKDFASCHELEVGACPLPFRIVEVDAETMVVKQILFDSAGQPMGAGTVGLRVGDDLFIGSFKGDRILRYDLREDTE